MDLARHNILRHGPLILQSDAGKSKVWNPMISDLLDFNLIKFLKEKFHVSLKGKGVGL